MKKLSILLIFAALAVTANAERVTCVFNVGMSCVNCENKIKSNLRFEKGVKDIVTSLDNQTVTVTYDDKKTDETKLRKALAKLGYEAAQADCTESSCCKNDSTAGK